MTALAWAERWARGRGLWRDHVSSAEYAVRQHVCEFAIAAHGETVTVVIGDEAPQLQYSLTPAVFWLFAQALDLGETVRRWCPDCAKRGEQYIRHELEAHGPKFGHLSPPGRANVHGSKLRSEGWKLSDNLIDAPVGDREGYKRVCFEPCPTCSAEGYLDTPLARVVCEAAPRACDHAATDRANERGDATVWSTGGCPACGQDPYLDEVDIIGAPGDPAARLELLARAYGLSPGLTDEERIQADEPATAARLRDHLEEHGVRVDPATRLLSTSDAFDVKGNLVSRGGPLDFETLREHIDASGRKPYGVFGEAVVLWLSGAKCETCKGEGKVAVDYHESMIGLMRTVDPGHTLEVVGCTSINGGVFDTSHGGSITEFAPCKACAGDGTAFGTFATRYQGTAQKPSPLHT